MKELSFDESQFPFNQIKCVCVCVVFSFYYPSGYYKSCMTLSSLYKGHGRLEQTGHAGFLVSTACGGLRGDSTA